MKAVLFFTFVAICSFSFGQSLDRTAIAKVYSSEAMYARRDNFKLSRTFSPVENNEIHAKRTSDSVQYESILSGYVKNSISIDDLNSELDKRFPYLDAAFFLQVRLKLNEEHAKLRAEKSKLAEENKNN